MNKYYEQVGMLMKKRIWLPKVLSYLMIVLMAVAVLSLVGLPWIIKGYIEYVYYFTGNEFVKMYFLIVLYVSGVLALVVLYELRLIFNTCVNSTPFIHRNVTSLRHIGFSAIIIGLIFISKGVLFFTFLTLIVVFVFALAALFCFVLADVFEEAVNYKLENDLTI